MGYTLKAPSCRVYLRSRLFVNISTCYYKGQNMLDVKMYRLRVKEVATSKGFSISKLSRVADVPIKTVRRAWNDPTYAIQLPSLDRLARALGVPVTDLLEDVPDGQN